MLMPTQSPATVVGVTAALLVLDIVAVALRFIARRTRSQSLKADDWLSFVALLLTCGISVTLFVGVAQKALAYPTPLIPLGKRTEVTLSNDKIIIVARLQYIFLVMSVPTLGAIKLSVLAFYRRIFVIEKRNPHNMLNILYIAFIVVIALWIGGYTFAFMFACKVNFSAWWTSAISLITNCVDTLNLLYSYAITDFITDALIILLPIPKIWSLQLPTRVRIGVIGIFLLGFLAVIASLIRLIWVNWAKNVGFDPSLDQNLLITTMLFWCMLEISLGVIACCLPTFGPLFQTKSVQSLLGSMRSKLSLRLDKSSNADDSVRLDSLPKQSAGSYREIEHMHGKRDTGAKPPSQRNLV